MQRYFINQPTPTNTQFVIDDTNLHHMLRVMRMKSNDQAILVFQDETAILSKVVEISPEKITYEKVEVLTRVVELPAQITIASGFPKGEKIEWITQKATELGVYECLFFPSERSVAKWDGKKLAKKQERLQKIAQEAAEQSHRTHLPKVTLLETRQALTEKLKEYDHILIAYEETAKTGEKSAFKQLLEAIKPNEKILAIFGSEGGLSPKEVATYESQKAICIALGPRILRTETAPLYFLSAVSTLLEL